MSVDQSFEQKKIDLLQQEIDSQKRINFYTSGGFEIMKTL